MQEDFPTRWRIAAALVGCVLLLLIVALLPGCGPTANNAAAAPAVQDGSTAAAPLVIPADAWTISVAWTPTPCAVPCAAVTPPSELHWTDGHTGQPCSWTQATGAVCGGAP